MPERNAPTAGDLQHDDATDFTRYLSKGTADKLAEQTGVFAEAAATDSTELPADLAKVRTELAEQGAVEDDHAAAVAARTKNPE